MGIEICESDSGALARMPMADVLCATPGVIRAGVLVALADTAAGLHAVPVLNPSYPVTADLSFRCAGSAVSGGWVSASSRVLRRRRTGAVFAVDLEGGDVDRAPLGRCTISFSALLRRPADADEALFTPLDPEPPCRTLSEVIAPRIGADRELELDIGPTIRNAFGALSGAVGAMFVAAAAERRASQVLGAACEVTGMVMHFLDPGRIGPVLAQTEVTGVFGDAVYLDVTLTDRGSGDRLMVAASAAASPAGPERPGTTKAWRPLH
jgi:acyl-coenzyme A thioesterase PaaI-like protein